MFWRACIAFLLASASGISAQQAADPAAVLARVRERLLTDLSRLPRYTCVQTITRNTYSAPVRWRPPASCAEVVAEYDKRKHELKLNGWDRLRLDVAIADRGEVYSWVGAPKFEEDMLREVAGSGALGSGDFGPFVSAIFRVAAVTFQKEQVIQGRRMLEYFYDVPESVSQYEIFDNSLDHWFITAYSGRFSLDADNPDLIQITARTAELRPKTGKCQVINEVEYGRVAIHGIPALIPHEARLRVIGRAGEESLNVTSYTNCREYSSKTVLRFDAPEDPESNSSKPPSPVLQSAFPPGLSFRWRVVTPIDSDTAAAGDAVEAVLRSPIRDPKGETLAPSGAHIHGRLVHFFHFDEFFGLALKFESIDISGATIPFHAALASNDKLSGIRLHAANPAELLPGAAEFRFRTDRLKLTQLESSGRTATVEKTEKGRN